MTDPAIRRLVNTLVMVNQAGICDVIARNIRSRRQLAGSTVEELYFTAVTGDGYVGGAINAILLYRHRDFGVEAFSHYLARGVTNALLPTSKEEKTFRAVEARTGALGTPEDEHAARTWVDRSTRPPEAAVIGRDLIEAVQPSASTPGLSCPPSPTGGPISTRGCCLSRPSARRSRTPRTSGRPWGCISPTAD